jgi:ankyrin repeat protein
LHHACIAKNVSILEILLNDGTCDVNSTEGVEEGIIDMTPLHFAARTGNHEIVKLLLNNGADKARMTSDGRTAVDMAFNIKF